MLNEELIKKKDIELENILGYYRKRVGNINSPPHYLNNFYFRRDWKRKTRFLWTLGNLTPWSRRSASPTMGVEKEKSRGTIRI